MLVVSDSPKSQLVLNRKSDMNTQDRKAVHNLVTLCERAGVEMTPENCLKCIGFAKDAMLAGECSVEAYYHAKNILLGMVEVSNAWVN